MAEFDPHALDEYIRQRKENERKNSEIFTELEEDLSIAELKHPVFATTFNEAVMRVVEELGEVAQARNKSQGEEREMCEMMDLLCVVWRLVRGDWR